MTYTFGRNGVNWSTLPREYWELVPLFCDECNRPIGRIAAGLLRYMNYQADHCSDKCRVLAEWHAPERR